MPTTAFAETYRRHYPPVRARARRMLRDDAAEDVAQETFLRLWKSGPPLEDADPRAIRAWLYRTCTRLSLDTLARRCRPLSDVDELAAPTASVEARLDARQSLATVVAAMSRDDLDAVLLVRSDGLTQPEAAEELGISERTLRRKLKRFDGVVGRRLAARSIAALVVVLLAIVSTRSCAAATADRVVDPEGGR